MQLPSDSWPGLAVPAGPHNLISQVRTRVCRAPISLFPFLLPTARPSAPPSALCPPRFTASTPSGRHRRRRSQRTCRARAVAEFCRPIRPSVAPFSSSPLVSCWEGVTARLFRFVRHRPPPRGFLCCRCWRRTQTRFAAIVGQSPSHYPATNAIVLALRQRTCGVVSPRSWSSA
jgi:hypothetical protein